MRYLLAQGLYVAGEHTLCWSASGKAALTRTPDTQPPPDDGLERPDFKRRLSSGTVATLTDTQVIASYANRSGSTFKRKNYS